jgi:RHS repeat-associated protein
MESYIPDYAGNPERDLMTYEEGQYKTAYVYGLNGTILSQKTSHIENEEHPLTEVTVKTLNEHRNLLSERAAEVGVLYHHQNRLGSADYTVDISGEVRSYAAYDEWGKPTAGTRHDLNLAVVVQTASFTGYTYDDVLDVYFAQFRFYDPNNRRFMSEDPIRSGRNWYSYVGNDPLNWVDPWGLDVGGIDRLAPEIPQPDLIEVTLELTYQRLNYVDPETGQSFPLVFNATRIFTIDLNDALNHPDYAELVEHFGQETADQIIEQSRTLYNAARDAYISGLIASPIELIPHLDINVVQVSNPEYFEMIASYFKAGETTGALLIPSPLEVAAGAALTTVQINAQTKPTIRLARSGRFLVCARFPPRNTSLNCNNTVIIRLAFSRSPLTPLRHPPRRQTACVSGSARGSGCRAQIQRRSRSSRQTFPVLS